MKFFLSLLFLLATAFSAAAQNTLVSGTVTDTNAVAWKFGTYTFTWQPSPLNPTATPMQNGHVFVPPRPTGTLDNTGSFASVSVPDNLTIFPIGSTWIFQACPAATATNGCYQTTLTITGGSQNITSAVIPPPVVVNMLNPPLFAAAYNDAEISNARQGNFYTNLNDSAIHFCSTIPPCTWTVLTGTTSLLAANNTWTGTNAWQNTSTFNAQVNVSAASLFSAQATFSVAPSFTASPGFLISSNTVIPNLNASFLLGNTWAVPAPIGGTTPNTGAFTVGNFSTNIAIGGGSPLATSNQSGTGNLCMTTNCAMTTPAIANPTINSAILNGSAAGTMLVGTDTKLPTAGAISNSAGTPVCSDANGGVTTTGCPASTTGSSKLLALLITTGICTTGGAETKCSTSTYTWPNGGFADANYAISCTPTTVTGAGTSPGMYQIIWSTKTATQFNLVIQSGSASAAGSVTTAEIDCIGVHP